jgi:cytidylate kinase
MKKKTVIFLKPLAIKNPTLDEQNDFLTREVLIETECAALGTFFNNEALQGKNLDEFIPGKVAEMNPKWVVAEGKCATIALKLKNQKKVLLNPKVSTEDLNNVSDFDIQNTYGFFDDRHEQDYERFQSVYENASWLPEDDDLSLFDIKEMVEEIINP